MVHGTGFLIGLPDDGDPRELRRQVLRWLTTEPKIGRSYTFYVGVQTFSMLIVDINKHGQFVMIHKRGWIDRKQDRLRLTQEEWKGIRAKGSLFCEDWV